MKCVNATPFTFAGHTYDCIADGTYRRDDGMVTFDNDKARYAYQAHQTHMKWLAIAAAAALGVFLYVRKS